MNLEDFLSVRDRARNLPAIRRLEVERTAQLAAERGGSVAGVAVRIATGAVREDAREAAEWVRAAIEAVRRAPGGEVFRTDEEAAEEIVRRLEERRS